jgi:hypothetical protein
MYTIAKQSYIFNNFHCCWFSHFLLFLILFLMQCLDDLWASTHARSTACKYNYVNVIGWPCICIICMCCMQVCIQKCYILQVHLWHEYVYMADIDVLHMNVDIACVCVCMCCRRYHIHWYKSLYYIYCILYICILYTQSMMYMYMKIHIQYKIPYLYGVLVCVFMFFVCICWMFPICLTYCFHELYSNVEYI